MDAGGESVKANIIFRTQFEATHHWPNCPLVDGVAFLRFEHRHVFHVTCKMPVAHTDRDVEFITAKREVTGYLREVYEGQFIGSMSCEMLCEDLFRQFPTLTYVCVEEDGENGAEMWREES